MMRSLASLEEMNWSPEQTRPSMALMPGRASLTAARALARKVSSASKATLPVKGISPFLKPMASTVKSCWTASLEITRSPTSSLSLSAPATPVLIIWVTWKSSTRIWAQMPALTLPMPHCTTTASTAPSLPSQNSMEALPSLRVVFKAALRASTSDFIAPMMPIFIYPATSS